MNEAPNIHFVMLTNAILCLDPNSTMSKRGYGMTIMPEEQ
jgi:hypothetical protein